MKNSNENICLLPESNGNCRVSQPALWQLRSNWATFFVEFLYRKKSSLTGKHACSLSPPTKRTGNRESEATSEPLLVRLEPFIEGSCCSSVVWVEGTFFFFVPPQANGGKKRNCGSRDPSGRFNWISFCGSYGRLTSIERPIERVNKINRRLAVAPNRQLPH